MSIEEQIEEIVIGSIQEVWDLVPIKVVTVKLPPNPTMGDFAVECFNITKLSGTNPIETAKMLALTLEQHPHVAKAVPMGPYINLTLESTYLFSAVCGDQMDGHPPSGHTVMVEYLSPNTNKPIHLGHTRNGVLGTAISNLLQWNGSKVIKSCLVNDRGVHICKSMLAWKLFGNGKTPESTGKKGDHFVGDYYVLFSQKAKQNPSLEDQAQEMLALWEAGDEQTVELWKMMNGWVYDGFRETYETLGFEFDTTYVESETYHLGKDIIQDGLERGIFVIDESGAVMCNLPENEFGLNKDGSQKCVTILRSDGTSVYMTQDIGTSVKKVQDFGLNQSIHVVGDEQKHHFQSLFHILLKLGYKWTSKSYHLAYGMVLLPNGKMKSREGTVVDADNFVKEVVGYAKEWIDSKWGDSIAHEEAARRAHVIGVGAIKYYLLNASPKNTIRFNPAESVSFDGATGPYCQYAYARAQSVLRKAKEKLSEPSVDFALLGNVIEERVLAQQLAVLPSRIEAAAANYDPSYVTASAFQVAKALNQFYTKCPVLSVEPKLESARLQLLSSASDALKELLRLLGIEVLEEM